MHVRDLCTYVRGTNVPFLWGVPTKFSFGLVPRLLPKTSLRWIEAYMEPGLFDFRLGVTVCIARRSTGSIFFLVSMENAHFMRNVNIGKSITFTSNDDGFQKVYAKEMEVLAVWT